MVTDQKEMSWTVPIKGLLGISNNILTASSFTVAIVRILELHHIAKLLLSSILSATDSRLPWFSRLAVPLHC